MRRNILGLALALLCSGSVFATSQRSFVSGTGSDLNPCSRVAPCRSFATAMLQTNANGEIVALDSAGFGPVSITQAVTIVAPIGVHAGISAFSGDGVTVAAGSTDVVVLRNLYINSQGATTGIDFTGGKGLHIEHCVVSGFSTDNIHLTPSVSAAVEINDTISRLAGASGVYANSLVALTVMIDRCRFEVNGSGVVADAAGVGIHDSVADSNVGTGFWARGSGGVSRMSVEASVASNNDKGFAVGFGTLTVHNTTSSGGTSAFESVGGKLSLENCIATGAGFGVNATSSSDVSVANSTIADNTFGLRAVSSSVIRLTQTTITRNTVGISSNTAAVINTAGDNFVDGNTNPNSATFTSVPKI